MSAVWVLIKRCDSEFTPLLLSDSWSPELLFYTLGELDITVFTLLCA